MIIADFGYQIHLEADKTLDEQRYDLDRSLYYQYFCREVLKVSSMPCKNDELNSNVCSADNVSRQRQKSIFDYVDSFLEYVASSR